MCHHRLPGAANALVIGQVTEVHVAADILRDNRVRLPPKGVLARMGDRDDAAVIQTFARPRPGARGPA